MRLTWFGMLGLGFPWGAGLGRLWLRFGEEGLEGAGGGLIWGFVQAWLGWEGAVQCSVGWGEKCGFVPIRGGC